MVLGQQESERMVWQRHTEEEGGAEEVENRDSKCMGCRDGKRTLCSPASSHPPTAHRASVTTWHRAFPREDEGIRLMVQPGRVQS